MVLKHYVTTNLIENYTYMYSDTVTEIFRTHNIEIPQCVSQNMATTWERDSPISDTVGAIVRGPTNRRMVPISPREPTHTWVREAKIRFPWIWRH